MGCWMVRKITKTYEYSIPEAEELYQAIEGKLTKAVLPDWDNSDEWTEFMIGLLAEIGASYGYKAEREYLRLDESWEIRLPDVSAVVLAFEHENDFDLDDITNGELQKLVDIKAFLKVLVCYPDYPIAFEKESGKCTFPEMQEKIRSNLIKNSEEKYLIITPMNIKKQSILVVSACLFDSEGNGKMLKDFQVPYKCKG
jgi:hypothetical protein